jgi:hypothetical protein
MKILKSYEIFKILKFYMKFLKFLEILNEILKFLKILTFFCNLIGRLEMKSRLWLDNVETPNRQ